MSYFVKIILNVKNQNRFNQYKYNESTEFTTKLKITGYILSKQFG